MERSEVDDKDIVIASTVRTPFGRYCGILKEYDYFDLGAIPMKAVLDKVNVPGDQVDEVFWGVGDTSVCKDAYTPVAARQTLLKAGLPHEKANINGSAIAIGHPNTASGARVIMNLMYELRRRGGLCAGWNLRRSGPGICMHHKSLNKEHGNEYGIHQS